MILLPLLNLGEALQSIFAPHDPELREQLQSKGVKIDYAPVEEDSLWKALIVNSLPLIFFLFYFSSLCARFNLAAAKL